MAGKKRIELRRTTVQVKWNFAAEPEVCMTYLKSYSVGKFVWEAYAMLSLSKANA